MARRSNNRGRSGQSRTQRNNQRAEGVGFRNYYEYRKLPNNPTYHFLIRTWMELTGETYEEARKLDNPFHKRVASIGPGRMASRLGFDPEEGVLEGELNIEEWRAMFSDTP